MAIPQRTLTKIRGETYTQTSRRSRKALWNMRKNTAAAPYVERTTTHMQFCTTYACQYILLIDRFAPTRPPQTGQPGRLVAVGWDAWDEQSGRGATSGSDGSSGSNETLGQSITVRYSITRFAPSLFRSRKCILRHVARHRLLLNIVLNLQGNHARQLVRRE